MAAPEDLKDEPADELPGIPLDDLPDDVRGRIEGHVKKYMDILQLGEDGKIAAPEIEVVDVPEFNFMGRVTSVGEIEETSQLTTRMELQKYLLDDDKELESTIAHEMVHHRDLTGLTKAERASLNGWPGPLHGARFLEGAARINAVMGPGYVTDNEPVTVSASGMSSSMKIALVLSFGFLAYQGISYLKRRKQQPPRRVEAAVVGQSALNERGHYGKRPAVFAPMNERGHYG